MKKFFAFAILFCFAVINHAIAQSKSAQKAFLTLGGNKSGSTLSVAQILDYPTLVPAAKDEKVESYELSITPKVAGAATFVVPVTGKRFSEEAINFLKTLQGQSGSITIKNIVLSKESIRMKEKDLEYTFNQ